MRIAIKSFWPGVISLVGATVLFCLPGEEFPTKSWFEIIYLDKWVHVGLLTILVLLWSLPLLYKIKVQSRLRNALIWTAVAFVIYGVIIEVLQGHVIPNRTFDIDDMIADAIGCALGFFLVRRQANHSKSPGD